MKQGIIQQSLSGFYDILADGEIYRTRARGNFRARKIKPIVGDRVEFENGYLLHVLPRKNELVRPPVANVDIAVVVTAAKKPTFSTNLLDRQLIALEAQKIIPVIYFSKTDLLDDDEYAKLAEIVDGYRKIGYQIFFSREAFAEDQLHQLKELLKDQIVTMMGQTGAGKSTLLNHFAPGLDLATGEISTALNFKNNTLKFIDETGYLHTIDFGVGQVGIMKTIIDALSKKDRLFFLDTKQEQQLSQKFFSSSYKTK